MRLTLFTLLGVAAGFVNAAATIPRDEPCLDELCGSSFVFTPTLGVTVDSSITLPSKRLTNAERFAHHLPPGKPRRKLHGSPVVRQLPSASPTITKRGYLQVLRTSDSSVLGYVSKTSFGGAQSRYQPDVADALIINFVAPDEATSVSNIDLVPENSDFVNQPYLGLIQGRDNTNSDLAAGSFHYTYIGGTHQTPAGSSPANVGNSYSTSSGLQRTSESAVWSVDLISNAVTLTWINTDSSPASIQLFSQGTALYTGGDSASFGGRFPSPIIPYKLVFVPI